MNNRYLSKSRFKLGCECPTKLFYTGKPNEYADQKIDDPFLQALADGGFQVGELAKHYFPGGTEIVRGGYVETSEKTRELIESGDATIYEAAFLADNFFIYADIVVCKGGTIYLYEVKAKSHDPAEEFLTRKGKLASKWESYLLDVAFQKMVIQKAFPEYEVKAHLTMADKTAICPTDGLNQKFRVRRTREGNIEVITGELTPADLNHKILVDVNVDHICDSIYDGTAYTATDEGLSFEAFAYGLANGYERDIKMPSGPSRTCKSCEFRSDDNVVEIGLKDGFKECWSEFFGWTEKDFAVPSMMDIWNYHYTRRDKRLAEKRVRMADLTENDIAPKDDGEPGLSQDQRQWMQVQKAQNGDSTFYLDKENLEAEISKWKFPLHFIDFETSMPAIPFKRGRRPYEAIAFQFSHHVVHPDGRIEHKSEYLNARPGEFPNFDFVRELKKVLEEDNGTIFRYSNHENTFLNHILRQMNETFEPIPDRAELIEFIKHITRSSNGSEENWQGERCMVDMLEMVKRYYYDPLTNGSNSIKQVLPAILQRSSLVQEKYSQPIYGTETGIKSFNFTDQVWIEYEDGKVVDPYKLLPKIFADVSDEDFELLMSDHDELKDGGAALTAYAKLQFQEMSDYERGEIEKALLKYCELDTLAMVLIYEGWKDLLTA